ncbi:hypothetical protein [Ruminiclostridium papyrosolvens]|uniref:Uncharacterized protein n=1 Tax=Ruminiclostridium papyrosolvens C7 TaxID=1330534 RepID=U4R1X5_9FIRM|nr:hypothetical protein [Ruminiclostridium papyrosolvens]EPR11628.1 hypothetical protein L323_11520 [Ruminiclostridium papyrosolvens C7]
MIKTNKLNKLNTSFAQNILSKYGIGRWKGQFTRLIFRNSSDMVLESDEGKEPFNYTEIKRYNTLLKVYKYINNNSSQIVLPGTTRNVSLKPSYNKHTKIINITTPTEIKLNSKTEPAKFIQKVLLNTNNQEQKYFFHRLTEKAGLESSDGFTEVNNGAANYNKDVYHITDIQNKENVINNKTDTKLFENERAIKEVREHTTHQNIFEKEITYKKDYEKQTLVREVAQKSVVSSNKYLGQNKLNTLVYNVFPETKSLPGSFSETIENRSISQTTIINKLITKEKYQHPESGELNSERFNVKNGIVTGNIIHSTQKQQINRNILREQEIKETDLDGYEKFVHFLPQKNDKSTDLIFYRHQLKEKDKKEQGIKDILPMDVMHTEKNVYAKATSPSKPDKKLQTIGNEEVKVLADKVFQILEKKLIIQKDRRGLR